jgi:hypothetical protein
MRHREQSLEADRTSTNATSGRSRDEVATTLISFVGTTAAAAVDDAPVGRTCAKQQVSRLKSLAGASLLSGCLAHAMACRNTLDALARRWWPWPGARLQREPRPLF